MDAAVEKVFKDIDSSPSEFFSTENGPAKGGFDFQLSSTERARSLARELMIQFGGHVNETNTLVGRKDGRDLLRHTFGVRLPSFLVGDYLLIQEKVYKVTRLDRRKAKLRLMEAPYTKKMVEIDTLRTPNILEKPVEVQIISSRNDQFLLLDPYTHQTVEAVSPSNWEGETIQALRFGNETFFLWNYSNEYLQKPLSRNEGCGSEHGHWLRAREPFYHPSRFFLIFPMGPLKFGDIVLFDLK